MKTTRLSRIKFAVALLIVLTNLFSSRPALASDGEGCVHTEATIQSLQACVTHAGEMAHIDNRGILRSLGAKLDAALAASARGQLHVVIAQLNAFVREVEAQSGKHVEAIHAEHMTMHAKHVVETLSRR